MSYRKCHSSVTRICVELILPQVCAICGFPTSLFTDVFGLVLWTRSVTRLLVRLWQCRCKGMRSSAKETQLVLQVSACIWVLQKVVTHQEIKTNCMCAFQFRNRIIIWLGIKVPIRRLIASNKNSGFRFNFSDNYFRDNGTTIHPPNIVKLTIHNPLGKTNNNKKEVFISI